MFESLGARVSVLMIFAWKASVTIVAVVAAAEIEMPPPILSVGRGNVAVKLRLRLVKTERVILDPSSAVMSTRTNCVAVAGVTFPAKVTTLSLAFGFCYRVIWLPTLGATID